MSDCNLMIVRSELPNKFFSPFTFINFKVRKKMVLLDDEDKTAFVPILIGNASLFIEELWTQNPVLTLSLTSACILTTVIFLLIYKLFIKDSTFFSLVTQQSIFFYFLIFVWLTWHHSWAAVLLLNKGSHGEGHGPWEDGGWIFDHNKWWTLDQYRHWLSSCPAPINASS